MSAIISANVAGGFGGVARGPAPPTTHAIVEAAGPGHKSAAASFSLGRCYLAGWDLVPTSVKFRSCCLVALGLCAGLAGAQQGLDQNPTINYTTAAVPAHQAMDDIARMAEKRLRVEGVLENQPIILRLHNVPYQNCLQAVAAVLHGNWADDGAYKVLRREDFNRMGMRNSARRARGNAVFNYIQERAIAHTHQPLTPERAMKDILTLYPPGADPSSVAYKAAFADSADQRLIDRCFLAVSAVDLATASDPNHAVFSNSPRLLQRALRLDAKGIAAIATEQNIWTNAMHGAAAAHPELAGRLPYRAIIKPSESHVLLIFTNAANGLPTRVTAEVVGLPGRYLVRAEDEVSIADPLAESPPEFVKSESGPIPMTEKAAEFWRDVLHPTTDLSSELKTQLLNPESNDPLAISLSEALLKIATKNNWNLVASPTDATCIDPGFGKALNNGVIDAGKVLQACGKTNHLELKDTFLYMYPIDPENAEARRSDRPALGDFVRSVVRGGYASIDAQAAFVAASGAGVDPSLPNVYLSLLKPTPPCFIGSSMSGLALYGSLTPPARKPLLNGLSYALSDFSDAQKTLLQKMLLDPDALIVFDKDSGDVRADPYHPEITEIIDGSITPHERMTLATRMEKVVRVQGSDLNGEPRDFVLTATDAAKRLPKIKGWKSLQLSEADAEVTKLTIYPTKGVSAVYFLRDYPEGFSPARVDHYLPPLPTLGGKKKGKTSDVPKPSGKGGKMQMDGRPRLGGELLLPRPPRKDARTLSAVVSAASDASAFSKEMT